MADNPTLRQIFFGELKSPGGAEADPRGTDPPAPRAGRDEGGRITDLGPGGGPCQDRGDRHHDGRRRGGESSRQSGRGDQPYRLEPYGRDGVLSGRQTALARRGRATASATSGGEHTGDSARRSRTRGRGTPSVLSHQGSRESSRERSCSASDRDRLYASTTRWTMAEGSRDVIMAASRGPPPLAPSKGSPSGRGHAATVVDCGSAIPRQPGTLLPAPRRRPQAPPVARRHPTDTHVSQEQRDAAHDRGHASALRREAPVPAGGTRAAAPRAPRVRALGRDGSTAATTPRYRLRLPAWRASCGTSSRTSCSPADTTPTILPSLGATCAGSTSRTWTSATGSRVDCPADSPRTAPSRGDHARIASAPATRTGRTTSSSAGTRWPSGAQLPFVRGARGPAQCRGREALDYVARTTFTAAPGRPTGRGPLPTGTT